MGTDTGSCFCFDLTSGFLGEKLGATSMTPLFKVLIKVSKRKKKSFSELNKSPTIKEKKAIASCGGGKQ